MNNRERFPAVETYDILVALRRTKENRGKQELCFRQIIRDEVIDLNILKAKIANLPGVWRIYKTINKRRVETARRLLMKFLIDDPELFEYRIDSLWKNCLLKKECKDGRKLLIDIDREDIPIKIQNMMDSGEIEVDALVRTPNGFHIVCPSLDTRLIQGIKDVEIKRDALVFVERFTNE